QFAGGCSRFGQITAANASTGNDPLVVAIDTARGQIVVAHGIAGEATAGSDQTCIHSESLHSNGRSRGHLGDTPGYAFENPVFRSVVGTGKSIAKGQDVCRAMALDGNTLESEQNGSVVTPVVET